MNHPAAALYNLVNTHHAQKAYRALYITTNCKSWPEFYTILHKHVCIAEDAADVARKKFTYLQALVEWNYIRKYSVLELYNVSFVINQGYRYLSSSEIKNAITPPLPPLPDLLQTTILYNSDTFTTTNEEIYDSDSDSHSESESLDNSLVLKHNTEISSQILKLLYAEKKPILTYILQCHRLNYGSYLALHIRVSHTCGSSDLFHPFYYLISLSHLAANSLDLRLIVHDNEATLSLIRILTLDDNELSKRTTQHSVYRSKIIASLVHLAE